MAKRQILPYPTSPSERAAAKRAHIQAIEQGKPIPHFKDEKNKLHYFDNKGGGRLMLNNLGTKLRNEANRRAAKKNLTPSEADYIDVWGNDKGRQLYKNEQAKLKKIYTVTPTATHDVDHINSQADGGVHHSRNLRMQNSSRNRSEGQRGLTAEQKNALMVGNTPKEHIALQGPQMTPQQRQSLLRQPSMQFAAKKRSIIGSQVSFFSPTSPINGRNGHSANGSIEAKTNGSASSTAFDMGFKLAN